jgi:hypothetical protein
MTGFEFGTTPAPGAPTDDWERAFRELPAGQDPEADPPPCQADCCAPAPTDGGLL